MSERTNGAAGATDDASVGVLVGRLTTEFGELVSAHVQLAKVELTDEIRRTGRGAGLLSGGAVAGLLALLLLSFAAAWGLSEVLPEGVAFLVVGLVWAVVAAVLTAGGRRELERAEGPTETIDELKEDQRWLHRQKI